MSNNGKKTKATRERQQAEPPETALRSDILPLPDPRFHGRIGNTYEDSEADIISVPTAPAGAPNVLAILLDDVGFGQASTFGGPANAPTLQRLADDASRPRTDEDVANYYRPCGE